MVDGKFDNTEEQSRAERVAAVEPEDKPVEMRPRAGMPNCAAVRSQNLSARCIWLGSCP